jgi:hypothetical protein
LFISLTAVAVLAAIALFAIPMEETQTEETLPVASPLASDAWLESFSLRAYRPMLRLATRTDGHILKSARSAAERRRYRHAQCTLLREYLGSLSQDFNRLNAIAADRSRRAGSHGEEGPMALLDRRIAFVCLMWSIEVRMMLGALIPFSVDVAPLLASVEALAAETREMMTRPLLRYRLQ